MEYRGHRLNQYDHAAANDNGITGEIDGNAKSSENKDIFKINYPQKKLWTLEKYYIFISIHANN